MSKKTIRDLLNNSDERTIERLTEGRKVMTEAERERIFAMSKTKLYDMKRNAAHFGAEDFVNGVESYNKPMIMKFAGMAAAAVMLIGGVGGAAYLAHKTGRPTGPDDVNVSQPATQMTTSCTTNTGITTNTVTTAVRVNGTTVTAVTAGTGSVTGEKKSEATTKAQESTTAQVTEAPEENTTPASEKQPTGRTKADIEADVLRTIGSFLQIDAETEAIYKEYAEVIWECCEMMHSGSPEGLKYGYDLSTEFIMNYREPYATAGYAFMDLNGDGFMELLLGMNKGNEISPAYNIFSVNANGEVCAIASGSARSEYFVCTYSGSDRTTEGMQRSYYVSNEGSSGANTSDRDYYRVGIGELNLEEALSFIYDPETGEERTQYVHSRNMLIRQCSAEFAEDIINNYNHVSINFIPFE